jgi:septum site-determining protein MinD
LEGGVTVGEVIAILSGKGGTGKTSVCAGIATVLAGSGERVLCIDCDIGLRNLDIALGLACSGPISFLEVCRGEYVFSQALQHPLYEKLFFLTAPVNCTPDDIDFVAFAAMLRHARELFDYVFLDAPAGVDLGFKLCASYADRVLMVTNPEPAAVRDAARAGQLLEKMGKADVRLVVNRINPDLFSIMELTVDDVMDETGLPLLGIVPEDCNVTLAAVFEKPLIHYTKRGAAAAYKRIAKRIQGQQMPIRIK